MKKHVLLIAVLFACTKLIAQNWTGAVNSDWNNSANWSVPPSTGDDIEIDPANYSGAMAQPVVSVNSNFIPAEMLVQNGAQLTISANLSASDRVEILGEGTLVEITAGTYALNGGGNNARLVFAEGAKLLMTGGNLTAGQRLLFELGGKGEVNGGTILVGETIALIDGSALESSHLILNNGIITTNGEFAFENEAGEFYPQFEQNGGVLNINGNLLWLGADAGSGRGSFVVNEGLTKVTGTISNDPASTMSMTLKLSGENALMQLSGTAVSLLAGDSVVIINDASWQNMATVNWQNNGVFHSTNNGNFLSGNSILSGTGAYQFCNVTVAQNKSLVHISPSQIAVGGNLTVAGTFSHSTNKLLLNGSTDQMITVANSNLYDLEINNSSPITTYGILVTSNLNISHNLNFIDGLAAVAPNQTIKIAQGGTISGGSDTSFVNGYLEVTGNNAVSFPLGATPGRYRPLSVTAPATASTTIRVAYKEMSYADLSPFEAPLQAISALEYWDLSRTGSDNLKAEIGWNDASQSGLTNCSDISLTVWDGSEWKFVPSTASGICDGENEGTLASSVDLPVVGPLTIGFTGNVFQQLVNICHTDSLEVGENVYYESGVYTDVLQGTSGDSTVITVLNVTQPLDITLSSTVTSISAIASGATSFQWIDCGNGNAAIPSATSSSFSPSQNGSYAVVAYQANCTAGDTSECISITQLFLEENSNADFGLYPNPINSGEKLTIQAENTIYAFTIYNMNGKILSSGSYSDNESRREIEMRNIQPGIYILEINTESGRTAKRFIVN